MLLFFPFEEIFYRSKEESDDESAFIFRDANLPTGHPNDKFGELYVSVHQSNDLFGVFSPLVVESAK